MSGMTVGDVQTNHSQSVDPAKLENQHKLEEASLKFSPNTQLSSKLSNVMQEMKNTLQITPEQLDHFSEQLDQAHSDLDKAKVMFSELVQLSSTAKQQGKKITLPPAMLHFMEDNHVQVDGKNIDDYLIGTVKGSQNISLSLMSASGKTVDLTRIGGEYYQSLASGFQQVNPKFSGDTMSCQLNGETYNSNIPPASGDGYDKMNNIGLSLFSKDGKESSVYHYNGKFFRYDQQGYHEIHPQISGDQLSWTHDGVTYSNSIPSGLNSVPTRSFENIKLQLTSDSHKNLSIYSDNGKFYEYGQAGYTEVHPKVNGNVVSFTKNGETYSGLVPHENISPRPNNMMLTLTDAKGEKLPIFNYRGQYSTYSQGGYTPISPTIHGDTLSFSKDGNTYTGSVPPKPVEETAPLSRAQCNSIEQALASYIEKQGQEIQQTTEQAQQILTDSKATASQLSGVQKDLPNLSGLSEIDKILNF
ncbi:hypothetical protein D5R81_08330 [Parashewanella spongiae]|uniref:Uncharacterized protein n=1 Tax=Parashewanella spongiae TaxID=342950 RepID=A0A3A6U057_9GAMM|nr:hypothetical protein [Parashewanella spongiae]MCL1078048.1 hypothetical protein [Parashewanella spongiae]RJY17433.1 hypothetical protein D5R81_08330 [Parashewanella spongiae]